MKIQTTLSQALFIAVTLLSTSWQADAEVPRALRSQMAKVSSNVATAESKLAMSRKYEPGSDGDKRAIDVAADRLGKAEVEVQGLPSAEPEVAALLERMRVVKATLAERRAASSAGAQAVAADNATLEAGLGADLETMEAVRTKLPDFRVYAADNEEIEGLVDWAKVEQDGLALVAKYAGASQSASKGADQSGLSPEAREMADATRTLAKDLKASRDTLRNYHVRFLPQKVEQYLKDAESAAAPGNEKTNIDYFVLGLKGAHRAKVFLDKFEIMAPWFPETDKAFVALARARVAVVEERVAAAKELVATKNIPPNDLYKGGEKEALRKEVAEAWRSVNGAKFVPLKIVISGDAWARHTSWVWHNDRWKKVDYSSLEAFVFYKGSDKLAFGWGVHVIKDHQAGNSLRVRLDPAKDVPANWSQVYLLTALK